ncbi:hypothetical protein [Caldalkalibacillus mannanilyticus]|uniref:hypothetical protein n=1 Tax=Caldalkalibacillus mannanilyticus TaxID=1418 RepID=UPI000469F4F6|nr:hypothetical protein [Caldalkalibacillus mannanilyticus]
MRKSFVFATIFVVALFFFSFFTSNWSYLYYISGTLGLACISCALLSYLDILILGNKGTFSHKEGRKKPRTELANQYLAASIPNLAAAAIYIMLIPA